MKGIAAVVVAICLATSVRAADEILLKDGTKISGTIVGFEENSFKVQTSYGFALVRKDKVAMIIPAEPNSEPKNKTAAASQKTTPAVAPAGPNASQAATAAPPLSTSTTPRVGKNENRTVVSAPAAQKDANPATAASKEASSAPHATAAGAPSSSSANAQKPASVNPTTDENNPPQEIHEEVQGNVYINHTYGFRMYKPPGWHVIEGAQKTLPTAIVAMGTGDETTLLVVGRERLKGSLESHATETEQQLREIYENYRRLSEQRSRVAGLPALERRYRGTVDNHDWSGVVASLVRGNEVYTVLGMTYADSDLIQIQENVIAKTIASLEFTSP